MPDGYEKQPCGHPVAAVYTGGEGTSHCAWCFDVAQEREECAKLAYDVARKAELERDNLPMPDDLTSSCVEAELRGQMIGADVVLSAIRDRSA